MLLKPSSFSQLPMLRSQFSGEATSAKVAHHGKICIIEVLDYYPGSASNPYDIIIFWL